MPGQQQRLLLCNVEARQVDPEGETSLVKCEEDVIECLDIKTNITVVRQ